MSQGLQCLFTWQMFCRVRKRRWWNVQREWFLHSMMKNCDGQLHCSKKVQISLSLFFSLSGIFFLQTLQMSWIEHEVSLYKLYGCGKIDQGYGLTEVQLRRQKKVNVVSVIFWFWPKASYKLRQSYGFGQKSLWLSAAYQKGGKLTALRSSCQSTITAILQHACLHLSAV